MRRRAIAPRRKRDERSAAEGTLIHEAIEGLLLGKNPDIPPQIAPAVTSFLHFYEKNNIAVSPELVERRIVNHDHRYAGTVDAIAVIGGKRGVLDIKTSQAIYRDYSLQTSAYMDALKNEFEDLQTRWILKNRPDPNLQSVRRTAAREGRQRNNQSRLA